MNLFKQLFGGRGPAASQEPGTTPGTMSNTVVVVSGLPRSGTSMMMKMLEAGGLPVLIDGLRAADKDNPEGYYELERVKALDKGDAAWLPEAVGKGVKVISALLEYLPPDYTYQVIFMHRHIEEVLRSQRKMLQHRGTEGETVSDGEIAALFAKHVSQTLAWLQQQPNFRVLEVHYNELLLQPQAHVRALNQFLGNRLDEQAMAAVVNPDLYRNRAQPTA